MEMENDKVWESAVWKKLYLERLTLAIGEKDALSYYYAMGDDIDYSIHPEIAADYDLVGYMSADSE